MPSKHSTKPMRSTAVREVRPKASQPTPGMTQADMDQVRWEAMYEILVAYQRAHGHCRVPLSTWEQPNLVRWVITQRRAKREGKLSAERVRRLNKLGFSWDVQGELERANRVRWEAMYKALVAYRRAHGHCRVPIPSKKCSRLSHWVGRQRITKREGKLSKDRVQRLEKLGFVWDVWEERWEKMFTALVKYKKVHGNCDVPNEWSMNPQLSHWVATQRRLHRKGLLLPERRKRLRAIAFRGFSERRGTKLLTPRPHRSPQR